MRESRRVFPARKSAVRQAKTPTKPSRVCAVGPFRSAEKKQAQKSFQGGKCESKISIPHPAIFRALSVSVGNSVYSVLRPKWHFLGCSDGSCCSPELPQLWALLISSFTSIHPINCVQRAFQSPLSSQSGASRRAQLKHPPQRAFPPVWAPSALPGATGQSFGLEEIQDKWTDFKHSKRTYFARLEGTSQLTILQYFQQIGTQIILFGFCFFFLP